MGLCLQVSYKQARFGGGIDMNYTKGEWKVVKDGNFRDIIAEKGKVIASVSKYHYPDQFEDNAHLIAASPEMYEALKELLAGLNNPRPVFLRESMDKCEKALLKAEGK